MVKRQHLEESPKDETKKDEGVFLPSSSFASTQFIPTGCTLLDCVLGGGWAKDRMINIVGDKSTGKSLLAIEACVNFQRKYPAGRMIYVEAEAAFDPSYAASLGLPVEHVEFPDGLFTVEDVYNHLVTVIGQKRGEPILFIVDSWDALSDRAEQDRQITDKTYGATKAAMGSQLFRRIVKKLSTAQVTLFIISQTRDNIGVAFGETQTRSGGSALDFYASQILWLHHKGRLKKTVGGIERPVGVEIKALCKKNKAGLPFRDCEFPIKFQFGVDDVSASLKWLIATKRTELVEMTAEQASSYLSHSVAKLTGEAYNKIQGVLASAVQEAWNEIENKLKPGFTKYGQV